MATDREDNYTDVSLVTSCGNLRYYLCCVYEVVDHQIDKDPLIGVEVDAIINCKKDTVDVHDLRVLFRACALLQPSVLLDRCFFVAPSLCRGYGNRFMDLTEARESVEDFPKEDQPITITVGEKTYKVKGAMVFKLAWLERNFVEPVKELAKYLEKNTPEERQVKAKGIENNNKIKKIDGPDEVHSSSCCIIA